MMKRSALAIATLGLAACAASGQRSSLLFTTLGTEHTLSGSCGTSMAILTPQDVGIFTPAPVLPNSAEKFAPHMAWNTLVGDEDGDASYYERELGRAIDALVARRLMPSPVPRLHDLRDVFFSPAIPIGAGVSGTPLRPADIAAVQIGGRFEFFIREEHFYTAMGWSGPVTPINLDAAAVDSQGDIFFSFERDHTLPTGALLRDGALLVIPAAALSYDSRGNVASVLPRSAITVFSEAQLDLRVRNAFAADNRGRPVSTIGDLDGLDIDPGGGTFTAVIGGVIYVFPNLFFCGENLTGCGVLSTARGGSIAVLDGLPLAATPPAPTTGAQLGLGLAGVTPVASLNGLDAVRAQPNRFVLDSPTPFVPGPGPVTIEWGGAGPAAPILLGLAVGPSGPSGVALSVPIDNPGFPDFYLPAIWLNAMSCPHGFGSLTFLYPGGPPGPTVLLQALTLAPGGLLPMLSAPETIQF